MPAPRRSIRFTVSRVGSSALFALFAWACSPPSLDAPVAAPTAPLEAKAPAGIMVSSTRPAYGDRGTTLDVHVIGSGFVSGVQATWLLHGVADPAKVRTNSTTFVSSTEVVANITVSADADLAFWDVQIMAAGGKNGVGTEMFEVSTAEYLGTATFAYAMNDAGQIVGYNTGAYIYDPSFGIVQLGAGQGWGVDPLGTMALGRNGSNFATAWVRQGATSSFVAQTLPRDATAVGGNATSGARDALGTLLIGGWQTLPGAKRGTTQNRPTVWRYTGSWSAPMSYALPAGSTTGALRDINGKGQAVGRIDASDRGAIWDDAATVTAIDGVPTGINPSGTIAVGYRNGFAGQPVYWYRTTSGAWTTTGTPLPTFGGTCGDATGVNDAGVVVGKSCDPSGTYLATLWRLDLTGTTPVLVAGPTRLPGLGLKGSSDATHSMGASKVTSTVPYTISGTAPYAGGSDALVRWQMW